MHNTNFKPCIVIPVYNHGNATTHIVEQLQQYELPIILVDDGSEQNCHHLLKNLELNYTGVTLKRLKTNQGKGGAVKAGLFKAHELGYSHALQIDADGQHCTSDVSKFMNAGIKSPIAIICGTPIYDDSVPKLRFYARYLTHIWIWINTLSLEISDSMCGYRLYPLAPITKLLSGSPTGNRMDFDPEVLVRWSWTGGRVISLPTSVQYPIDGISHFSPWRDNYLISKMHAKLFFLMLVRLPNIISRKLSANDGIHV